MLQKLQQVAREGTIQFAHLYLGHIKRDDDRKILAHADVMAWEDAEPAVRAVLQQHLYQAIEGDVGDNLFPCMYTGDMLSVARVASEEFDRTVNRPAVEILEGIRDMTAEAMGDRFADQIIEFGNALSYKVMAAGAIKNHLVAVLKFFMVPALGAQPVQFAFATVVDLDDQEASMLDEQRGRFVTQALQNVIKRSSVSRAVLFPCLDDNGGEYADLLIYASSGAAAWFKALEATRRFSPRQEGQALVRMITEQTVGTDVPHDLFERMGGHLAMTADDTGMRAEDVATGLERAVGHGIDRLGFQARWENTFGDLGYKPAYESLFAGPDVEKPAKLKMQAGDIQITLMPTLLAYFRQMTWGGRTFIAFEVPERAKVHVGKDLDMRIREVTEAELLSWIRGDD